VYDDEGCNQSFHGTSQILSEFLDVRAFFRTDPTGEGFQRPHDDNAHSTSAGNLKIA
jgi:hypothetical protein